MATKKMSAMSLDNTLDGTERILAQGSDGLCITTQVMADYAVDQLHGATVITSVSGSDELVVFQSDTEKIISVTNMAKWVVDSIEAVDIGTTIVATDWVIFSDAGTLKRVTLGNLAAGITITGDSIDIDGTTDIGAALADGDEFLVDDGGGGTNRRSDMSRVFTYVTTKIQALAAKATPVDADILMVQDSASSDALKETTVAQLWDNRYLADLTAISDVSGMSWFVDEDAMGSDSAVKVPSQQSVKAYVDDQADWLVHDCTQLNAVPEITDYMVISDEDVADDPNRGVTVAELFAAAGDITDLAAAPNIADRLLLTDESEANDPARSMSVQNLFNTVNAGLASFTGAIVVGTDQFLIDDNGTSKRVTYQVMMDGINDLAAIGAAPAVTDSVLLDDGGTAKKCTTANLHLTYFKDMTEGTGISTATGEICEHSVCTVGGLIKTEILIDLTGLHDGDAVSDIIGKTGGTANCYIGRILAAVNGTIVAGKVTCYETPAGGDPDINICVSTDGTGAQSADSTGLAGYSLLINHGDWTKEDVDQLDTLPSANDYLYLACGTNTNDAYTAGILLIEIWGK